MNPLWSHNVTQKKQSTMHISWNTLYENWSWFPASLFLNIGWPSSLADPHWQHCIFHHSQEDRISNKWLYLSAVDSTCQNVNCSPFLITITIWRNFCFLGHWGNIICRKVSFQDFSLHSVSDQFCFAVHYDCGQRQWYSIQWRYYVISNWTLQIWKKTTWILFQHSPCFQEK